MEKDDLIFLMEQPERVLKNMQPKVARLVCACKNCDRFTRVWDFDAHPWYYAKNLKPSRVVGKWFNTQTMYYFCPRHYKYYNAALKVHGKNIDNYFYETYIDLSKIGQICQSITQSIRKTG